MGIRANRADLDPCMPRQTHIALQAHASAPRREQVTTLVKSLYAVRGESFGIDAAEFAAEQTLARLKHEHDQIAARHQAEDAAVSGASPAGPARTRSRRVEAGDGSAGCGPRGHDRIKGYQEHGAVGSSPDTSARAAAARSAETRPMAGKTRRSAPSPAGGARKSRAGRCRK
jgi:hypothetical protein